jgi:hypothetical protein
VILSVIYSRSASISTLLLGILSEAEIKVQFEKENLIDFQKETMRSKDI